MWKSYSERLSKSKWSVILAAKQLFSFTIYRFHYSKINHWTFLALNNTDTLLEIIFTVAWQMKETFRKRHLCFQFATWLTTQWISNTFAAFRHLCLRQSPESAGVTAAFSGMSQSTQRVSSSGSGAGPGLCGLPSWEIMTFALQQSGTSNSQKAAAIGGSPINRSSPWLMLIDDDWWLIDWWWWLMLIDAHTFLFRDKSSEYFECRNK